MAKNSLNNSKADDDNNNSNNYGANAMVTNQSQICIWNIKNKKQFCGIPPKKSNKPNIKWRIFLLRLLTFGAKRLSFTKVINFSRGHRIVNKIKYFELLMNIRKLSSFLFHKTCRLIYTSPSGLQFNGNAHWMDESIHKIAINWWILLPMQFLVTFRFILFWFVYFYSSRSIRISKEIFRRIFFFFFCQP